MTGYTLEFKRNYDCSSSRNLQALVYLGNVDDANLFVPDDSQLVKESTARAPLDREAQRVPPPRGGQDVRAPLDGVSNVGGVEGGLDHLLQHRLILEDVKNGRWNI